MSWPRRLFRAHLVANCKRSWYNDNTKTVLQQPKVTLDKLAQTGMSVEKIAEMAGMNAELVKQWVKGVEKIA